MIGTQLHLFWIILVGQMPKLQALTKLGSKIYLGNNWEH